MIFPAHPVTCSAAKKQSVYAFDACNDKINCWAAGLDGAIIHSFGLSETLISFRFVMGFGITPLSGM